MLTPAVSTLAVIAAFIVIYRRYKTDVEELLILKLIGYYLLGSFKFTMNSLALPAGFIVYALFFSPERNRVLKKAIACLGFAAFLTGLLLPVMEKAFFERHRTVSSSSNNIFYVDLNGVHNTIKQKLGINGPTKLEDFKVDFEQSGKIKELSYMFFTYNNNNIVLYRVDYNASKNKYTIKPNKVKIWPQYDRLIDEQQFFYALKYLDLKKAIPSEQYPYYTLRCNGDYSNWEVRDFDNYFITENGFEQINDEKLPVEGFVFWVCGNKKTDEGDHISYSTDNNRAYILSGR